MKVLALSLLIFCVPSGASAQRHPVGIGVNLIAEAASVPVPENIKIDNVAAEILGAMQSGREAVYGSRRPESRCDGGIHHLDLSAGIISHVSGRFLLEKYNPKLFHESAGFTLIGKSPANGDAILGCGDVAPYWPGKQPAALDFSHIFFAAPHGGPADYDQTVREKDKREVRNFNFAQRSFGFGLLFVFMALMLFSAAVYCIEAGCKAIERGGNIWDRVKAAFGGPLLLLAFLVGFTAGPLGQWLSRN